MILSLSGLAHLSWNLKTRCHHLTLKYYLSFKFTVYMSEINSKILDCTHYIWIAKCRNKLSDTKEICKIWNIKVKKFPVFYRTGRYIPVFTTAHCRSLSWSRWIQIKSSRATSRVKWLSEEKKPTFRGPSNSHPPHCHTLKFHMILPSTLRFSEWPLSSSSVAIQSLKGLYPPHTREISYSYLGLLWTRDQPAAEASALTR
jgi:hypothetical protein